MARSTGLVLEHLENVSGQVLERYQAVIQKMIRGRSGIYAQHGEQPLLRGVGLEPHDEVEATPA